MVLSDFLSALKTPSIKVTLLTSEGDEIIKFFSEGYSGVESDILARTIKKFEIVSNTALNIVLNDVATTPAEQQEDT